jgi:hypothetical protein
LLRDKKVVGVFVRFRAPLHGEIADPSAVIFTGRVPHEVERYYSLIDILTYPRKKSR